MPISDTQRAILAFIAERIEADGVAPTQTEISRAFGFKGVRAAQYHLEALEAAGAIQRFPGRARAIRICAEPAAMAAPAVPATADALDRDAVRLPVLGNVAAGAPIGSGLHEHADVERSLLVDPWLFSPRPDYLLQVRGDSMRDEGILDGDLIGVHRTRDARSGQIVVARLDDEITVKVLSSGRDGLRLLPRNADYAPIEVGSERDFAVEGLYCGLLRPNR